MWGGKAVRWSWIVSALAVVGCTGEAFEPAPYCSRTEREVSLDEETLVPSAVTQLGESAGTHTCSWAWRDPSPLARSDHEPGLEPAEVEYRLEGPAVLTEAHSVNGQAFHCEPMVRASLSVSVRVDGESVVDLESVPVAFDPVGTALFQGQLDPATLELGVSWTAGWRDPAIDLLLIVQSTGASAGGLFVSGTSAGGKRTRVTAADWSCGAALRSSRAYKSAAGDSSSRPLRLFEPGSAHSVHSMVVSGIVR